LLWEDAAGKQIGSDLSGLPYGHIAEYEASTYTVTAPAGAAQVALRFYGDVGAQYKGPPTAFFLDQVRLLHLAPVSMPVQPEKWEYSYHEEYPGLHVIDDPEAAGGHAMLAPVGEAKAYIPMTGGRYTFEQPTGEFLATYRAKVKDNTKPIPVLAISVNDIGNLSYVLVGHNLKATDFKQPGVYQDFTLRFIRPEEGSISYVATYLGGADVTFDKVTVVQLGTFTTDQQLSAIWLGE
jgi:hypothetical protein